jgi:hypothetical protein
LRRRQAIVAILRRCEAERLVVELVEQLILEGGIGDDRATAIIDGLQRVSPLWLAAASGDRLPALPTRLVAGRAR